MTCAVHFSAKMRDFVCNRVDVVFLICLAVPSEYLGWWWRSKNILSSELRLSFWDLRYIYMVEFV